MILSSRFLDSLIFLESIDTKGYVPKAYMEQYEDKTD